MELRYLGWAGLELSAQGESILIDYVQDGSGFLNAFLTGEKPVPARDSSHLAALVTHLHEDHTDVAAVESAVGPTGTLLRPAPFARRDGEEDLTDGPEDLLSASRLEATIVTEWETTRVGPFAVTPVPAVDGLGAPQVGWVVEADGTRVFHGGDTMMHGYWWLIAKRFGPFDVAALPVNGAVVTFPQLQPASDQPAALTPEQAVRVAGILGAASLLPIHFGVDWPGAYREDAHPVDHVERIAGKAGLPILSLRPGDARELTPR